MAAVARGTEARVGAAPEEVAISREEEMPVMDMGTRKVQGTRSIATNQAERCSAELRVAIGEMKDSKRTGQLVTMKEKAVSQRR